MRQNPTFLTVLPSSAGVWSQSEPGCWGGHRECPKLTVRQLGYPSTHTLGTWGSGFPLVRLAKNIESSFSAFVVCGLFPRIIHFFTSCYYEDIRHQELHFDLSCSLLSYTEYLKLLAFCTKGPVLL